VSDFCEGLSDGFRPGGDFGDASRAPAPPSRCLVLSTPTPATINPGRACFSYLVRPVKASEDAKSSARLVEQIAKVGRCLVTYVEQTFLRSVEFGDEIDNR
jgi:hypothetical protein